ncbi:undecaprenyl diphosphate synthase [Hydrogenispora ethanolica]|jgi:undecaprenyl diphosphate synthase|uniref:Isoprenyl transferase n=1 Tax=Hydrogenispora ethanolica TaxID=1082276 RepID=A0A4R1RSF9_HYDET|nr:isoprenyl transferase [Hydrogenispora ethanolica]TCL69418.1 undecaprenyl diphosphate synthase [Hydrogenispora ethanolica]
MRLLERFSKKTTVGQEVRNVPQHVAIIMDGNGRWARKRGLPRTAGHRAGMERVRDAIDVCLETKVPYLTLYAFSTENWRRPVEEVSALMDLFSQAFQHEVQGIHQKGVQIRFIGLRDGLSPSMVSAMDKAERLTAGNQLLHLNVALNYGGRAEIVSAITTMVSEIQQSKLSIEKITESEFAKFLFTSGQPDPDLLIKPGGEYRISNFLIWQLAYTELYFSDTYWPDFGRDELLKAFAFFSGRERRFGGIRGGGSER